MKWLIGILIALNLVVFALAKLSDDSNLNDGIKPVSEDVSGINLLNGSASPLPGNCTNLGPIEQQLVLDQVENLLADKALSYRVVSEAARKIAAHRVIIKLDENADINEIVNRLKAAGVNESFEKTRPNGERILSLGVFTYKNTANELANNLIRIGFSASAEQEFLQYPQRYWVNLNQSIDKADLAALNSYVGNNKIQQNTAKCL